MGRGIASAPLDVQVVQQAFALRQDGVLLRRRCHIDALSGEPATFTLNGRLLVRVYHQGRIRRPSSGRVAWALATGQWPKGVVRARNGDEHDLRPQNLQIARHGAHRPNAAAGRASSLDHRAETNAALLQALAERANPTLAELSEAIGRSEGCVSTRLNKLQTQGLALSPQCVPGRSWCLSQAGRAAVQAGHPVVVLDQRDCDILRIIARALAGIVAIARRVEVCNLTARRRADLLVAQKLAKADERRRYVVTDEGRKALGDSAPQPWVRMEMVSAANARDVHRRMEHPNDDRTAAERSKQGSEARAKALQTTQANKAAPFNAFPDWLLTG